MIIMSLTDGGACTGTACETCYTSILFVKWRSEKKDPLNISCVNPINQPIRNFKQQQKLEQGLVAQGQHLKDYHSRWRKPRR